MGDFFIEILKEGYILGGKKEILFKMKNWEVRRSGEGKKKIFGKTIVSLNKCWLWRLVIKMVNLRL